MPPTIHYPQPAIRAYQRAQVGWHTKVHGGKPNDLTYIAIVGGVVVVYLIYSAISSVKISIPNGSIP
ncbi:MAG: hypothetical protein PHP42_01010 [Bacteroidota bacterium]|nr:hypothetical protein [Bacteroidota bacterium]